MMQEARTKSRLSLRSMCAGVPGRASILTTPSATWRVLPLAECTVQAGPIAVETKFSVNGSVIPVCCTPEPRAVILTLSMTSTATKRFRYMLRRLMGQFESAHMRIAEAVPSIVGSFET